MSNFMEDGTLNLCTSFLDIDVYVNWDWYILILVSKYLLNKTLTN
jgi:hypothetical protein